MTNDTGQIIAEAKTELARLQAVETELSLEIEAVLSNASPNGLSASQRAQVRLLRKNHAICLNTITELGLVTAAKLDASDEIHDLAAELEKATAALKNVSDEIAVIGKAAAQISDICGKLSSITGKLKALIA